MKRIISLLFVLMACLSFVIALLYPSSALAATCEQPVATVVSVQGTVESLRAGETQWQPVKLDDTYCPGDTIRVGARSRASVTLANQSVLRLNQNSEMTFQEVKEGRTSLVDLFKGAAHFFSRKPESLEVRTRYAIAGVRGTEFFISVERDQMFMSVFEGNVLAQNEVGSVAVTTGQSVVAEAGKAPILRVVVRPRDAVQWALYYPPVIYYHTGEAPRDTSDPRFLAYRASTLLAVGRVDEASTYIDRSLRIDPNNSDALALQAIIAVVQNDKDKALDSATKAVDADSNSATALIALSYAQQARFDLEGARKSLEVAVKVDPENTLAWARLAEIQASFGDLTRSLEAAKKAAALDPKLARTQTVLGFAYLIRVETKEARDAFGKAIELDQAAPLPRLGLGLAIIRDGKLDEGARQIEIAASLDPNNSLIRSYLGKTYYEEKRIKQVAPEFEIAKELDPNDPTPYFYSAIHKQTTNRPVEALRDLQKSIELNNNRAVYRSKLALDSDLAARSSSLARIYNNLGFQQLGLVEGWTSVNTDPTNFSAHRFLADSYAARPRHEIARVSELLQSQLLQPINITPLQPTLAESNLFLISSQGPAAVSFSEFNPLFNMNRVAIQGSAIYGENRTYGAEAVFSGIQGKSSFSLGGTLFQTDGYRQNNDQDETIANVFFQQQLSYKSSIQGEYRYRQTDNGDLQQRFFEDDFNSTLREDEETQLIRLGFRHAFQPNSTLIGNFQYQKVEEKDTQQPTPTFPVTFTDATSELPSDAWSGEFSYLHRSRPVDFVGGIGYFNIDAKQKLTIFSTFDPTFLVPVPNPFPPPPFLFLPLPPSTTVIPINRDVEHTNAYLYSYIKPVESLTITVGGSYDSLDTEDELTKSQDQGNPKLGIVWNAPTGTTLRGAVFRTLKRTLITDQTLEPTQVAGFNQFFDDVNATDAWRYGGAIDQKFTNVWFGGEYSERELDVPFNRTIGGVTTLETADWKEKLARAYFFATPYKWISLSAEWIWERNQRDADAAAGARRLETNYFPLGFNFFHPIGFNATFKGTYVDQQGSFERLGASGTFENGQDDFWLLDAVIGYRLPKRYGFITLGVTNLTDEDFEHFDTDRDNPRFQPDRFFFAKFTLAVP